VGKVNKRNLLHKGKGQKQDQFLTALIECLSKAMGL